MSLCTIPRSWMYITAFKTFLIIQLHSVIVNFCPKGYKIIKAIVRDSTFLKPLRNSLA